MSVYNSIKKNNKFCVGIYAPQLPIHLTNTLVAQMNKCSLLLNNSIFYLISLSSDHEVFLKKIFKNIRSSKDYELPVNLLNHVIIYKSDKSLPFNFKNTYYLNEDSFYFSFSSDHISNFI